MRKGTRCNTDTERESKRAREQEAAEQQQTTGTHTRASKKSSSSLFLLCLSLLLLISFGWCQSDKAAKRQTVPRNERVWRFVASQQQQQKRSTSRSLSRHTDNPSLAGSSSRHSPTNPRFVRRVVVSASSLPVGDCRPGERCVRAAWILRCLTMSPRSRWLSTPTTKTSPTTSSSAMLTASCR